MKLQYVHWDNFRHLTGLDRTFAHVVDDVLAEGDRDSGGAIAAVNRGIASGRAFTATLPPFALVVERDLDAGTYGFNVSPFAGERFDAALKEGAERYGEDGLGWALFLVVKSGECRSLISMPLPAILWASRDISGQHQVYSHSFTHDENGQDIKGATYIGVTKRGWRTRWTEHVQAAQRGSRYRFHQAIKAWDGRARTVSHHVIAVGLTEAAAMAEEERMVGFETLYPKGLNMIPGGYAGLRQIGAAGANERVTPDDKHSIVDRFFESAGRRGLPNPLAAANWCDPDYAERVICAGEDRLKPAQIRDARFLASLGSSAAAITAEIGARNETQVRRLLSGSTYSRVA